MRKIFVLGVILLIALSAGMFVKSYTSESTKNIGGEALHQIKDFRYIAPGEVTCDAIVPECGHCPGKIIDRNCYEEKSKP